MHESKNKNLLFVLSDSGCGAGVFVLAKYQAGFGGAVRRGRQNAALRRTCAGGQGK